MAVKDWRDFPDLGTPLSASALEDLEIRTNERALWSASAQLSTMDRLFAQTEAGQPTGTIRAAPALVRQSQTYNKVRFATGTTAPAGLTDARVGIWNADASAKLAETGNLSGTITAAATLYDNLALTAGVALNAGDLVVLGVAFLGTTPPDVRAAMTILAIAGLSPPMTYTAGGWAGGALPSSLSAGGSNAPRWIEAMP